MAQPDELSITEKLQKIIATIDVASATTAPLTESIENLLHLSAHSLNSEEASVIVRDGDSGDLIFLSAIGKVADKIIGMKIPSGKGIAGFVFSSGQPMAITDAGREESFYADVDKKTGYSTQTILATPLRYNDEIIGVLEYINRVGEPPYESFSPLEMDKAAFFAEAVSALVNAYEAAKIFRELGEKMLIGDEDMSLDEIRNWLETLRSTAEHREMIDLAVIVRELSSRGSTERKLCKEILEAFLRHSDSARETSFLSF